MRNISNEILNNEREFKKNEKKIKEILKIAFSTKYYGDLFRKAGITTLDQINTITYMDFSAIPITSKNEYDENKFDMFAFDANNFDKAYYQSLKTGDAKRNYVEDFKIRVHITSGSTGQPLEVFKTYKDYAKDYLMLSINRMRLTDYQFKGKFIWIWPINMVIQKYLTPDSEFSVVREVNKHGYMYCFYEHSDKNFRALYDYIAKNNFEWVTSSPTLLCNLIKYINRNGLLPLSFKYIECHSEKLHDWQKEIITQAFGVAPVSIYSSNEVQFMGAACEQHLHVFNNTCFIEFIENDYGRNDLVVTSLNYTDIPIVRYRLGDCGRYMNEIKCSCTLKEFPVIELEGFRSNDFIRGAHGELIEPYIISDAIYLLSKKYQIAIKQYKVKQIAYDVFEFFLEKEYADNQDLVTKCVVFLKEILKSVLGYESTVIIKDIELDESIYYGNKYKYFESNISSKLL